MTSVVDLIKGTDGLLPTIETNLSEDFSRYQIRGWNFDTGQGPTGYRYRDVTTDPDGVAQPYSIAEGLVSAQEITIGKVVTIGDGDIEAAQDAAVQFRERLDIEINKWYRNCADRVEDDAPRITGTMFTLPDVNVPSRQTQKSWAFVIIRTFSIAYRLG